MSIFYLSGVSNDRTRELAEDKWYGRLGVMAGPDTCGRKDSYQWHIPSYRAWGMDNGCFSNHGAFDESSWLRTLDFIVNYIDDAHETCLFGTAPDVYLPHLNRGDWEATLKRSSPVLPKIRALGVPAALVFQDGQQHHLDRIDWDSFDVAFIGGGDEFKLGYPHRVTRGNPSYMTVSGLGALDYDTLMWAEMIMECHRREKAIHVGRVNSLARLLWAAAIGADSADGTYLRYTGLPGVADIEMWLEETR